MVWSPPSPLPAPITTPRTVVRQYQKGDGPALFEAIDASRSHPWAVIKHTDVADSIYFVEHALRKTQVPTCLDFPFVVVARDEPTTILGGVGFHRINAKESCGEIGYWLRADRHGEGLCTEAVSHSVTLGFKPQVDGGWGFRRITLLCAAKNRASSRVAEKLGMRFERREKAERYNTSPEPGYFDQLGYAVLATEWDSSVHHAVADIGWTEPLF